VLESVEVQALAQFGSLPVGVDLIVMRQERTSAANVAATAAKVSAASASAAAAAAFVRAPVVTAARGLASAAVLTPSSAAAISSTNYDNLLQQLQYAFTTEAVASISYYRDIAFAAALCGEFSDAEAADGALADAALYAAASKTLHNIFAGQGSPTSAEMLASLLVQAKRAVPQIEAQQATATMNKDYPKAAGLQKLVASILDLVHQVEALLQEQPSWPKVTLLQRFSFSLQRYTTHMMIFKKWFSRFFVLTNGRLYYSDGNNGHPDSKEGTLSFVRSNPAPDIRYCIELRGCSVAACSAPVDGQAFSFEIKFAAGSQAANDVVLAAADEVTRQRCMRIIQAASQTARESSLEHIVSAVVLTRNLFCMKSAVALKFVLDASGITISKPSLDACNFPYHFLREFRFDATDLKVVGFDAVCLRLAGFDVFQLKVADYDAESLHGAGFDLTELAATNDIPWLIAGGINAWELSARNFTALQFRESGCHIKHIMSEKKPLWTCTSKLYPFSVDEVLKAGYELSSMVEAGWPVSDMQKAGLTASQLKDAGSSAQQLRDGGYPAIDVKNLFCLDISSMLNLGYRAESLNDAGFSYAEMLQTEHPELILRYGAYVYATLHARRVNDGFNPSCAQDGKRLCEVPFGWDVAPGDVDDSNVCGAHPWHSSKLVFADGVECSTYLADRPYRGARSDLHKRFSESSEHTVAASMRVDSKMRAWIGTFDILLRKRADRNPSVPQ
jgi:hypothetical protein